MNIIIHPTYFPTIAHFVAIANAQVVTFEKHDNFQKQSYRNRTKIYGANGKLQLSVPVTHTKNGEKIKYTDTQIKNVENWQTQHWRSIVSAYKSSPFFEYYQDDIKPIFDTPKTNLFELNIEIFKVICECIELDININYTTEFIKKYNLKDIFDGRHLTQSKKETHIPLTSYTQVFGDKYGYLNNLSILDLLFNEGPNTLNYLEEQNIYLKMENELLSEYKRFLA